MKTIEKLALARKQVASWQRRKDEHIRGLVRAETTLPGLLRTVARLERKAEQEMMKRALSASVLEAEGKKLVTEVHAMLEGHGEAIKPEKTADDLAIPDFLRREAKKKDEAAAAKIVKDIADTKREKAKVRAQHKAAKKNGDLKKMPPQGKDAMRAILAK